MTLRTLTCFAFCGVFAFAGCASAPVDTFYAHEKPAATATLTSDADVMPLQINRYTPVAGQRPAFRLFDGGGPETYAIPAGENRVSAQYRYGNSMGQGVSTIKKVQFTAEPGHRYRVVAEAGMNFLRPGFGRVKDNEWDVKVIDRDTDAVMAETHDRGKPSTEPA